MDMELVLYRRGRVEARLTRKETAYHLNNLVNLKLNFLPGYQTLRHARTMYTRHKYQILGPG